MVGEKRNHLGRLIKWFDLSTMNTETVNAPSTKKLSTRHLLGTDTLLRVSNRCTTPWWIFTVISCLRRTDSAIHSASQGSKPSLSSNFQEKTSLRQRLKSTLGDGIFLLLLKGGFETHGVSHVDFSSLDCMFVMQVGTSEMSVRGTPFGVPRRYIARTSPRGQGIRSRTR